MDMVIWHGGDDDDFRAIELKEKQTISNKYTFTKGTNKS
jgi:hypothetical protein